MSSATWRLRPALIWLLYALALFCAPLLWSSSLAITLLSQIGVAIVACLSFNILLGQGGMLSFGHAVYTGLGGYAAIHLLRTAEATGTSLPVSLLPLAGGVAGLAVAAVLGWVSTRKAGMPFAMITLAIGELVHAMTGLFPAFFGGEGGLSANRVIGEPVLGISFGPSVELYYLIAAYCLVCTALMYGLTRTPLGLMLQAVRDNAERVDFLGLSASRVRYVCFVIAGGFAGIAGALSALLFEIVSPEALDTSRSAAYLVFTFIGGISAFHGPMLGAVLMVLSGATLATLTRAWPLYLGLAFMLVVMYAPAGLAGLPRAVHRLLHERRTAWPWLALAFVGLALLMVGASWLIEMTYHLREASLRLPFRHFGVAMDSSDLRVWLAALLCFGVGFAVLHLGRRRLHAVKDGR